MNFGFAAVFFVSIFPLLSFAQSCPWVATANQPLEKIVKDIEKKSGKKPTVSCGAGADFKVCHSCTEKLSPEQWQRIRPMLAEPTYRRWHERLHSSAELDALTNGPSGVPYKDVQGESFLFAHREMIRATQANLAALGLPCVAPWAELPAKANDPQWPTFRMQKYQKVQDLCALPENKKRLGNVNLLNAEMEQAKQKIAKNTQAAKDRAQTESSDVQKRFAKLEEIAQKQTQQINQTWQSLLEKYQLSEDILTELKGCPIPEAIAEENKDHQRLIESTKKESSPDFLRQNSLGKMGDTVSVLWHGTLHLVYNTPQPPACTLEDVAPECDNMDSNFSSHVNINFYKIHSYIDGYIDKWLKENKYQSIEKKCNGRAGCYQWKGSFLGPIPDFVDGSGCTITHDVSRTNAETNSSRGKN